MEGWINPDPYVNKTEDFVCRSCNKTFQINTSYDKNGFPVSFQPKYCIDCNMKPKITGAIGSSGTVSIESAKIPQRNVEGLEDALGDISIVANDSRMRIIVLEQDFSSHKDEFKAFKKHIEHDIEEKEFEFDIHKNVTEQVIKNNKLDLDVFKSAQTNFNEDQIGINLAHFTLIKEIHKTLIIGFCIFIVFSLATWGYLLYNLLKH
jgi:hypothetical protein